MHSKPVEAVEGRRHSVRSRSRGGGSSAWQQLTVFDHTLHNFNEFDLTLHDFNEFDLTLHDFNDLGIHFHDFKRPAW